MKKIISSSILAFLLSNQGYAQAVKLIGTLPITVKASSNNQLNTSKEHELTLMAIQLSESAKSYLARQARAALAKTGHFAPNASVSLGASQVQLGMNGVPVLNQGKHGTCVTFAVTAALDAVLGQGDYISQLCSLQLGNYLEKNGFNPSGWDGSWGRYVLGQTQAFGVISKDNQRKFSCGGLTDYPLQETEVTSAMPVEEYHQVSEELANIDATTLLDWTESLNSRVDTNQTLLQVKKALREGNRVTFGTILVDVDLGFVGAVGTKQAHNDTWVLTPEILRDLYLTTDFAAHEMIITGYDDNAIARDDHGQEHKGLLTLRNSWGEKVGDQGNFYMSYDYFKVLVIEAYRIRQFAEQNSH